MENIHNKIKASLSSGDTMGVCGTNAPTSDYYQGHTAWGGCRLA